MVVALLLARVLAVADRQHLGALVEVAPGDPADLLLAHGGGHGELDDPPHWDQLARVAVEVGDELGEFVVGGSPVALVALADQAQPLQCDPPEVDLFDGDRQAVHGGGVRQHQADCADIHRDHHRTGALRRARAAELDDQVAVELGLLSLPSSRFNMASVASFERPGALATSHMSAMCRSTRSAKVAMPRGRADFGISPRSIRLSMSVPHRRASSRLWKLSLT
jgi:hypothetical protein